MSGRPCKHGTTGMRAGDARNRCLCEKCVQESKERDRARYYKDRDAKLAYQKKRFEEHRERILENNRQWRLRNREILSEKGKAWYQENKEQDNARRSQHYESNKAATRLRIDVWYQKNKSEIMARNRVRDATRAKRIPEWFGELDSLVIEEAYDLCEKRQTDTGAPWELDHMLPVCGRSVSGLHVWNNIQVIPRKLNRAKRHREILTIHGEWLGHT